MSSSSAGNPRVAFVGSYVPRRCGIATFTHDLATAVAERVDQPLGVGKDVSIVAMNDGDSSYDYGPEVALCIRQDRKEDYHRAADFLNHGEADVVSLQHEFGIFGGPDGIDILELVDRLHKPLVTTLHTVLAKPTPAQREVTERLARRSHALVVMSRRAREMLIEHYDALPGKVRVIPHGAPDVPFVDTEPSKAQFGLSGRPVVLTFGLLSPDKGIEMMIDALRDVVPSFPDLVYVVLGITHPLVRRASGEAYRTSLESRALEYGLQDNVEFRNLYPTLPELCEYLLATDIYVTPYAKREQVVSGTLAYAAATGRAVISTPYWYAEEVLADGRGRLVEFGDVEGAASHLNELLERPDRRNDIRKATWDHGRSMVWSNVAQRCVDLFREACRAKAVETSEVPTGKLPGIRLRHLSMLTDDTGLLQHSTYSTPDRNHGYATDDNARALIAMAMMWSRFEGEEVLPYLQKYLSFLHHARSEESGRFHNFLSYDRRWLDDDGSDDCQGRSIWALGELIARSPTESTLQLGERLFRSALDTLPTIGSVRGRAFAVLGLDAYLSRYPRDEGARSALESRASSVAGEFPAEPADGWPWYEDVVTYDNARLPEALLVAGARLEREDLVDQGIRLLRWLLDVQSAPQGWLSIVGNDGWLRRGGENPRYDQQPLEVPALIGACRAAFRATEDPVWLAEMRRCFDWFLGRNDQGCALVDFQTHACCDGLTRSGVNANQGAESTLSWLLSLLIMHEVHGGELPEWDPTFEDQTTGPVRLGVGKLQPGG